MKMTRRNRIVILVIVVLVGVGLLFLKCWQPFPTVTECSSSQVSEFTGLWLPAQARVDAIFVTDWQDKRLAAKASFDAKQLDTFMEQFVNVKERSTTQRLGVSNDAVDPRPDWWDPDNASDFETIRYMGSGIRDSVELLIDNSTEDAVTVYILQLR